MNNTNTPTATRPLTAVKCSCGDPLCTRYRLNWSNSDGLFWKEEAQLIVKAVNNYEPMLKALEEINDLKAISLLPEHLYALIISIKTVANEAIQSAKGLT